MALFYTSLILTTKQKLTPSEQQCFYSPFSAHCASSGHKPKLLNDLWCNVSERSEEGRENTLCDKDTQYFFSPMAKHTFRKAQGFDRFLSGHWGNWKQLKCSSNATGINKILVSTGLNRVISCDSLPIASNREKGYTGNSLWLS